VVADVSPARIEQLARRVRWFDRNRHTVAFVIGAAAGVAGLVLFPRAFGPDWPLFHERLLAIVTALVVGFSVEIGLAGALAVWEVEHDRLLRDRGLPRAILRVRKRKTAQ
jgi:hypothetical protein